MKKVTIKEVAKEAGVSISTVSNALNDVDVLNPKTKAHILEVAKRLNYVPNMSGKLLKAGKSNIVGFVTSSVEGPYFYHLVEAMARECEKNNYTLNVIVTHDKEVVLNTLLGSLFDGIIVFERNFVSEENIKQMQHEKIKAVFLDRKLHSDTMSSVLFDSYEQSYEATKYLISLGHTRIGFITGHETMYDGFERKKGFMAAMSDHGLTVKKEDILVGFFEEATTYHAVRTYLTKVHLNHPSAFLAGNDLSAIGCIKALNDRGLKVPEDISVMGFDDIDIASYFSPPLTTVSNPIHEQGRLAVQKLLNMIEGNPATPEKILNGKLIIRKSCFLNQTKY